MELEKINVEKKVKIVYMGTPDFSATVLKGLLKKYEIRAIVSQPDRSSGRNGEIKPTPVKKVGNDNTILVIQPEKIKEEYAEVLAYEPDLIITCAYGQILPKELLDAPRLGCINVHASLLPKLRGGAPIHHAIIDGHSKTGITIMYMNEAMDEGDIIAKEEVIIEDTDTASSLHDKLSILGSNLLEKTLPSILNGTKDEMNLDNLKNLLEENGYTVASTGHTTLTQKTTIINRTNQTSEVSNKLKDTVGVGIVSNSNVKNSEVDFTIIIGADY